MGKMWRFGSVKHRTKGIQVAAMANLNSFFKVRTTFWTDVVQ
jgi:hypothetical protein